MSSRSKIQILDNYFALIKVPIDVRDSKKMPKNKMVFLCTGSQGEQRAALARIANGTHPDLHLEKDDNVIFSSRIIPGNEKRLYKIFNDFSKSEINVLSEENSMIHVSGHPAREDLKKMYSWIKPKILIPVHGEQRHMAEHINFAKEMGVKFPIKVSNGEIIRLAPGEPQVVDKVTWGRVYLDGKVLIDNDSQVLKERRNMAANGYMEITVLISKNGEIKNNPIITLKGIPLIEEDESEIEYDLEDVVMDTCKTFNLNNSKQEKNLIDTLKGNCRKLINDKSGKKPLVNINFPSQLLGKDNDEKLKVKRALDQRNNNTSGQYIIAKGYGLNIIQLVSEYLITTDLKDIHTKPQIEYDTEGNRIIGSFASANFYSLSLQCFLKGRKQNSG